MMAVSFNIIRSAYFIAVAILLWPVLESNSLQQWSKSSTIPASSHVYGIASDDSGDRITVVSSGGMYSSNDRGVSFTKQTSPSITSWTAVACSGNGSVTAASVYASGGVYVSTNYNKDFSRSSSLPLSVGNGKAVYYVDVTVSNTGKYLATTMYYFDSNNLKASLIYISSDFGSTWSKSSAYLSPDHSWTAIDSSADFQFIAAIDGYQAAGGVHISSDYGNTWAGPTTPLPPATGKWTSLSCDKSCKQIIAIVDDGGVWVSGNYGTIQSWTQMYDLPKDAPWSAVASDESGMNLAVVARTSNGAIYVSNDGGNSWFISSAPPGDWRNVASDGSGLQMVASLYNSGVYISQDFPTSQPSSQPSSRPTCTSGKSGNGTSCDECTAGYMATADRSICVACPLGSFSLPGSVTCTSCNYPASNNEEASGSCEQVSLSLQSLAIFLCVALYSSSSISLLVAFGRKNGKIFLRCVALLFLPHLLLLSNLSYLLISRFYSYGLFASCLVFILLPNFFFIWKLHKKNAFYPTLLMIPSPFPEHDSHSSLPVVFLSKTVMFLWKILNFPIVIVTISSGFFMFQSGLIYIRSINNFWSSIWLGGLVKSKESQLFNSKSLFSFSSMTIPAVPKNSDFDLRSYNEALLVITIFQSIPQLIIQRSNNLYTSDRIDEWSNIAIVSFVISLIFAIRGIYKLLLYVYCKKLDIEDIPLDFKVYELIAHKGGGPSKSTLSPKSPRSAGRLESDKDDKNGNMYRDNDDDDGDGDIEINFDTSPMKSSSLFSNKNTSNMGSSKNIDPENDCGELADWLLRKVKLKYKYSEKYALLLAYEGVISLEGPKGLRTALAINPFYLEETFNISRTHCKQIYNKLLHRDYPAPKEEGSIFPGLVSGVNNNDNESGVKSRREKNPKSLLASAPTFIELPNSRGDASAKSTSSLTSSSPPSTPKMESRYTSNFLLPFASNITKDERNDFHYEATCNNDKCDGGDNDENAKTPLVKIAASVKATNASRVQTMVYSDSSSSSSEGESDVFSGSDDENVDIDIGGEGRGVVGDSFDRVPSSSGIDMGSVHKVKHYFDDSDGDEEAPKNSNK